jgi:secondary thiamine-phosphate synthase enzyme
MAVLTEIIALDTPGNFHVVDITDKVDRLLTSAHVEIGIAALFAVGSTAALTTVEYEPGLVADLEALFERLAPGDAAYKHDEAWHDGNGHSHVRASLLGPSLVVPVLSGRMTLGQWQQIIFVDFDVKPRRRQVICQISGGPAPQ